jgi:DNA topoisomerase IB
LDTGSLIDNRGTVRKGRSHSFYPLAKLARLHHITDNQAGITRHKGRSGFDYRDPGGAAVHDPETLQRIKSLVIPVRCRAVDPRHGTIGVGS